MTIGQNNQCPKKQHLHVFRAREQNLTPMLKIDFSNFFSKIVFFTFPHILGKGNVLESVDKKIARFYSF